MQTKTKQINMWCELVISYLSGNNKKALSININKASENEIFSNKKIQRQLNSQGKICTIAAYHLKQISNRHYFDNIHE